MSKDDNKGGYGEDQQLQQPKKRSLGRISEMQDGWLLTPLWLVVDGRETIGQMTYEHLFQYYLVMGAAGACRRATREALGAPSRRQQTWSSRAWTPCRSDRGRVSIVWASGAVIPSIEGEWRRCQPA